MEYSHPTHNSEKQPSLGGVEVLKPLSIPALRLQGQEKPLRVPIRPYEKVVKKLLSFKDYIEASVPKKIFFAAWIVPLNSQVRVHPAALEARGLSLHHLVFLESSSFAATLQSVCETDAFHAIVVESVVGAPLLQIARRWTKSSGAPQIFHAEDLNRLERTKLVLFLT
jgi:hypothetical protein